MDSYRQFILGDWTFTNLSHNQKVLKATGVPHAGRDLKESTTSGFRQVKTAGYQEVD